MPESTILDTIVARKREEVAERQKGWTSYDMLERAIASDYTPRPRGFVSALRRAREQAGIALIAEVKKASPSAGIIRDDFEPVQIARTYEDNGAACLSVLTDQDFFQGSDDYLTAVRENGAIPILRKDFTIDEFQVYEARLMGADAILLIAAILTMDQLRDYQSLARAYSMDALVEVHTEDEMRMAIDIGAGLIGINSRDLNTFKTDLAVFERLAPMAPAAALLVAESGIKTPADVARVAAAGASAILVGESLMRQPDIGAAVRELLAK